MTVLNKTRITSIDFLRGTIMIIMALDHVRDYLYRGSFYFDPLDLDKTNGVLYFTRWITHFCAPIFMLLAGTSAFLSSQRKSKKELSVFLVKRGIWLIFLEMFIVNFGWNFNIAFPMFLFITIWALGVSMIVLAALIYLPKKLILAFSLLLIAGHNLLDPVHFEGNNLQAFGWSLLHYQQGFFWGRELLLVGYPLIPLIAVMPLGYCLGELYTKDFTPPKRQRILAIAGWVAVGLFIVIRFSNIYGEPVKWTTQKDGFFTFLSFMKVSKYPPSFLYLMITIGPGLLFLAYTEKIQNRFVEYVSVYGRVPMFYYLVHIYIIHLVALLASMFTPGQNWKNWILDQPIWFTDSLRGYGFSLPIAYLSWVILIIVLYPLCRKYDRYKQSNKDKWWLSYL